MSTIDPLAIVYAGIQVYKLYADDKRFDVEMAALAEKKLDADGVFDALRDMRVKAAQDAHAAVERMAQ